MARSRRPVVDSMLAPNPDIVRPPALLPGGIVRVISPASAGDSVALCRGIAELERLGYHVQLTAPPMQADGYFAAPPDARIAEFTQALRDREANAVIAVRGGYGSAALLDGLGWSRTSALKPAPPDLTKSTAGLAPKLLIGYSDITVLQIYLWQRWRWTTIYGPMVAAGFDGGADRPGGYDLASFLSAVAAPGASSSQKTPGLVAPSRHNWTIPLCGETLIAGTASGVLLGGCLTLLQTTLGTPWEIDTRGGILLLEDRGVKPYQVDRMLVHLAQAGKFRRVRGIVLGEFPDCDTPAGSNVTVREVCRRILGGLGIPIVFGAAVGHTPRPIVAVPLGVRARLIAAGEGKLEILEPAVSSKQ
jgi:muramoyltetrapeptide carboxypeptidase